MDRISAARWLSCWVGKMNARIEADMPHDILFVRHHLEKNAQDWYLSLDPKTRRLLPRIDQYHCCKSFTFSWGTSSLLAFENAVRDLLAMLQSDFDGTVTIVSTFVAKPLVLGAIVEASTRATKLDRLIRLVVFVGTGSKSTFQCNLRLSAQRQRLTAQNGSKWEIARRALVSSFLIESKFKRLGLSFSNIYQSIVGGDDATLKEGFETSFVPSSECLVRPWVTFESTERKVEITRFLTPEFRISASRIGWNGDETSNSDSVAWFTKSCKFSDWIQFERKPLLWLKGQPGSGKTRLMHQIIESLSSKELKAPLLVVYPKSESLTSWNTPLKSLIESFVGRALAQQPEIQFNHNLRRVMSVVHHRSGELDPSTYTTSLGILLGVLHQATRLLLVIEDIDDQRMIEKTILTVWKWAHTTPLLVKPRIVVASRIPCLFLSQMPMTSVDLDHKIWAGADVSCSPVHHDLRKSRSIFKGVFHVKELSSRLKKTDSTSLQSSNLKKAKNDSESFATYERLAWNISSDLLPIVEQALSWVIYAQRQLHISELLDALRSRPGSVTHYNPYSCVGHFENLSTEVLEKVLDGWVKIEDEGYLKMTHQAMIEYVRGPSSRWGNRNFEFSRGNENLAITCLSCLTLEDFLLDPEMLEDIEARDHPGVDSSGSLHSYASRFWRVHYQFAESTSEYLSAFFHLHLQNLIRNTNQDLRQRSSAPWGRHQLHLQVSSKLGLKELVKLYCELGANIDHEISGNYGFDPSFIDLNNFEAIGEPMTRLKDLMLYTDSHGADLKLPQNMVIENLDDRQLTPLCLAILNRHDSVVDLLLAKRPTLNRTHGVGPLLAAASVGNLEMCSLLLKHGADPNTRRGIQSETPLHQAVAKGDLRLVKLLLEAGARPSIPSASPGETPLHIAATIGALDMCAYLLHCRKRDSSTLMENSSLCEKLRAGKTKVQCNSCSRFLHRCSRSDRSNLQLHTGWAPPESGLTAEIALEAVDVNGWTPLHAAAANGHLLVCKLFLDCNADPRKLCLTGLTPQNLARRYEHLDVAKLLKFYDTNTFERRMRVLTKPGT